MSQLCTGNTLTIGSELHTAGRKWWYQRHSRKEPATWYVGFYCLYFQQANHQTQKRGLYNIMVVLSKWANRFHSVKFISYYCLLWEELYVLKLDNTMKAPLPVNLQCNYILVLIHCLPKRSLLSVWKVHNVWVIMEMVHKLSHQTNQQQLTSPNLRIIHTYLTLCKHSLKLTKSHQKSKHCSTEIRSKQWSGLIKLVSTRYFFLVHLHLEPPRMRVYREYR